MKILKNSSLVVSLSLALAANAQAPEPEGAQNYASPSSEAQSSAPVATSATSSIEETSSKGADVPGPVESCNIGD